MGAEVQQHKTFFGENSIVPGQQTIPSHTAEMMHQVVLEEWEASLFSTLVFIVIM